MSEPQLVIQRHDPRRRLKWGAAGVAGALLLFVAGLLVGWYGNTGPRISRAQYESLVEHVQRLRTRNAQLKASLAAVQSSERVARNANAELRATITDLKAELARVRGELKFYRGLAGAGGASEGLAVHGLRIRPVAGTRLYAFTLSLTQNLERAHLIHGTVKWWVTAARDGGAIRRPLTVLGPDDAEALHYEFKYFQVLRGRFTLPAGLEPERIVVKLVPAEADRETVKADFDWSAVVQRASATTTPTGDDRTYEQH